ncbi:MAG: PEP-CTERM sorting domain-containing protein [Pseudomonadales bacterium]|nr:PEP-CTERM sorting domain-containing protein [Pseudomonadales bacterium]
MRFFVRVIAVLLTCLAIPAHALLIDFTSSTWSGVSGSMAGRNISGIAVTLSASGGSLTFNAADNAGCLGSAGAAGVPLACAGDGIGIGDDEVTNGNERLSVTFANPVDVLEIYLLDLFNNQQEQEMARISVTMNGAPTAVFDRNGGTDSGGFIITGITRNNVTQILFEAIGRQSDFSLAAISISVPEPGTLVLLGTGLLGLGLMRRKAR